MILGPNANPDRLVRAIASLNRAVNSGDTARIDTWSNIVALLIATN